MSNILIYKIPAHEESGISLWGKGPKKFLFWGDSKRRSFNNHPQEWWAITSNSIRNKSRKLNPPYFHSLSLHERALLATLDHFVAVPHCCLQRPCGHGPTPSGTTQSSKFLSYPAPSCISCKKFPPFPFEHSNLKSFPRIPLQLLNYFTPQSPAPKPGFSRLTGNRHGLQSVVKGQ